MQAGNQPKNIANINGKNKEGLLCNDASRKKLNNLFMISTHKHIDNTLNQTSHKPSLIKSNQFYQKGKSYIFKNDMDNPMDNRKSIMMNFKCPPEKFFISEMDQADMFENEEPVKKAQVLGDIDRWEYKHITSKFKKNEILIESKQSNKKNEVNTDLDDKLGLNVNILNDIYKYKSRKHDCHLGDHLPHGIDKYDPKNKDKLNSSKDDPSKINDLTKQRLMNKELLNEIYYNKAWDAYKKGMTPQELEEARQLT